MGIFEQYSSSFGERFALEYSLHLDETAIDGVQPGGTKFLGGIPVVAGICTRKEILTLEVSIASRLWADIQIVASRCRHACRAARANVLIYCSRRSPREPEDGVDCSENRHDSGG